MVSRPRAALDVALVAVLVLGLLLLIQSNTMPQGAMLMLAAAFGLHRRALERERQRHRAELAEHEKRASDSLEAQRLSHSEAARLAAQQSVALEEKNRELVRLSEAKSQFLAAISHELRTPLSAVIGFSELLLDRAAGPVTDAQAEYLSDIRSAATHLLRLINDILDYSKLEVGRLELRQAPTEVDMLVEEAVHMLQASAQRKGVRISMALEEHLTVLADPLRLKQVVLNLVANAVKFTPTHGRVDVRLTRHDGLATLAVADTGIGIAPEHHRAIFEPFMQVESDESRTFEGSGLGLALVKRLLEPMGGIVRVESEAGQGATFFVDLPLQTQPRPLTVAPVDPPIDVVVAEDDDATRHMLCRLLAARACEVRPAANGQRALEALAERLPDVLLLDLMMPELDGFEVIQRLRALPRGERVRVLVFSASEPAGEQRAILERAGARIVLKGTMTTLGVAAVVQELAHAEHRRSAA